MKVTYYLDVISSWCFWAEPAWAELKQRFAGRVEFGWKIALLDAGALPANMAQEEWYYRRSGTVTRSPFMLNTGWFHPKRRDYLAPNLVAEAAKDLGVTDDRVRLALTRAAVREGRNVGDWSESLAVAADAAGLNLAALEARARSAEVEARARASTAEFHSFQVTQRPTFLLEDAIGDRAIFSGLVVAAPLIAAVEAMLADTAAYASFEAHFGKPPPA